MSLGLQTKLLRFLQEMAFEPVVKGSGLPLTLGYFFKESRADLTRFRKWVEQYQYIFYIPTNQECQIVTQIFNKKQYLGFIKRKNILKGMPVADPFIIAAAKVKGFTVVTQESNKSKGARIPTACKDFDVNCIDLEGFLENEKLEY